MKSLKRKVTSSSADQIIASKTFLKSTRNGKVQKVVREIYLRRDIPCSSQLCTLCPSITPTDASGHGKLGSSYHVNNTSKENPFD